MTTAHANFIEDPGQRGPKDRGLFVPTTSHEYYSIFVEVSLETYNTQRFRDWLEILTTRLSPEAQGIAISIKPGQSQAVN